jgi:hypothetical protein
MTVNTTHKLNFIAVALVGTLAFANAIPMAHAQSRYDELANLPFKEGYISKDKE